jgi:hypothetical protein
MNPDAPQPSAKIVAELVEQFGEIKIEEPTFRRSTYAHQTWGTWSWKAADGTTKGRIVQGTDGHVDPRNVWSVHRQVRCKVCDRWTGELIEEALSRGLCHEHRGSVSEELR